MAHDQIDNISQRNLEFSASSKGVKLVNNSVFIYVAISSEIRKMNVMEINTGSKRK